MIHTLDEIMEAKNQRLTESEWAICSSTYDYDIEAL